MMMDTATSESVSPGLAFLLQASDSMYPSGAYAHSLGLEGAVQDGLVTDVASYARYVADFVVPQLIHVELPTAGFAYDSALADDLASYCRLDEEYGALKATRELRNASANIGSQRLALLNDLAGDEFVTQIVHAKDAGQLVGHEVLILGLQSARTGIRRSDALASVYYLGLAVLTNAVVKLIKIGQQSCQRILWENLERAGDVVAKAELIPESEIGWFAPSLDIASARHETAYSRLFIS